MPGSKIPVLEVERLSLTKDGRGLVAYNDATNTVVQSASPWTCSAYLVSSTASSQAADPSIFKYTSGRPCFPTASSMGWWKIHYVSGSTYGPTGASCYIPVFRNLDVNTA